MAQQLPKRTLLQVVSLLGALEHHRRTLALPLLLGFLVLGISLATLIPPFQIPDENTHWHLVSSRLAFTKSPSAPCLPFIDLVKPFSFTPESHVSRTHKLPRDAFAAVANQKPVCTPKRRMYGGLFTYPGALAALTMRDGDGPVEMLRAFHVARILQGLMVLLTLWRLAVLTSRRMSGGTLAITAFLFSGLAVQESFGVTADGAQLAFATALCSIMLAWDRLRLFDAILFAVVGWAAMTSKPFLLPAIIPAVFTGFVCARSNGISAGLWTRLRDFVKLFRPCRRPDVARLFVWLSAFLCVVSVWSSLADFGTVPTKFNSAEQKKFLLAHPLVFLVDAPLSLRAIFDDLADYTGPLGWLDAPVSQGTVGCWKLLLWTAFVVELALLSPRIGRAVATLVRRLRSTGDQASVATSSGSTLTRGLAVLAVFVAALLCLYVAMLPLYLVWTPTGGHELHGFQTRYVLPNIVLLIGAAFAFLSSQFPTQPETGDAASSGVAATATAAVISVIFGLIAISLLGHYYWDLGLRYY